MPESTKEFQIGLLLAKNGFQEQAISYFCDILAKNPDDIPALINMGACCRQVNNFKPAMAALQRATHLLAADNASLSKKAVLTNLASLHEDLGEFDQSILLFQQAYDLFPHDPAMNINYAYALLREGLWLEAWPRWEWGRSPNAWAYPTNLPRWTGREDLKGKRLLVCREGGYGDVFMYLRWLPDLKMLCDKVGLWAWKSLDGAVNGLDEFIPSDETTMLSTPEDAVQAAFAEDYDYFVPLMSIPACLKAEYPPVFSQLGISSLVAKTALRQFGQIGREEYLQAVQAETADAKWPPKMIGLCPRAEEMTVTRKHRSLPNEDAFRIMKGSNAHWVSLVPGCSEFGQAAISKESTWLDTAKVILQCDLIISVDSAVAHLAGSLGVPCWVMLPLRRDFKWGLPGKPHFWYPRMKYIQQTDPVEWGNVVDVALEALRGT